MRVGVTLPQFRDDPEPAIAHARRAEELGLDGVFVFDHLWAIGRPDGPSLSAFPLLGALAAETSRVALGTLVARVGLVPNAVLVNQFVAVGRIAGIDRVIAGVGTGDRVSAEENRAYGLDYPPAGVRRSAMASVLGDLRRRGFETWVGGGSERTVDVARAGGHAVNLWQADLTRVGRLAATGVEVTWGGEIDPVDVEGHLSRLADAGATWAVAGFNADAERLGAAAARVR